MRGWAWTGFRGNSQLWQWLHLLLLPAVIGTLPLWIQHPEYLSRRRRNAYIAAGTAFAALVLAGYLVPPSWTGFPGNTLWNWLQLTVLPIALVSARFLVALLHSLRENQRRRIICAVAAAAWALTVVGGYAWHWNWTGYQHTAGRHGEKTAEPATKGKDARISAEPRPAADDRMVVAGFRRRDVLQSWQRAISVPLSIGYQRSSHPVT